MGVKLSEIAEYKSVDFGFFKGKTVGIDFSNMCYQFLSSIRSYDGELLMNDDGQITSHLVGISSRIPRLIEYGLKPVFIFDGKPPKLKTFEKKRRQKLKEDAIKKLQKAKDSGDVEGVRKYSKRSVKMTPEIVESSKKLLEAFGLPVVQAPMEADAQGAELCKNGKIYCVASSDFDNLLFGSLRMVSNLTLSNKRRMSSGKYVNNELKFYELRQVLDKLGITHDKLIALGILVGTDYNSGGVRGVGAKTALKKVKEHDDLEEIFSEVDFDWKEIFDMFKEMKVEKNVNIEFKKFDREKVFKLLVDDYSFSESRVDKIIKSFESFENERRQKSLIDF